MAKKALQSKSEKTQIVTLPIGCHVSVAGGVWNAPKNAHELGCETFQIFTRPPQGGTPPKLTPDVLEKFQEEMTRYGYSYRYGSDGAPFVVHCPYFVNFGSAESRIAHGSGAVVRQELERANLLGARFVMTHLGTAKALGQEKAFDQTKKLLVKALEEYESSKETAKEKKTQLLLEIAAGAGEIIGDSFEELAELMEPLKKYKSFGGICFDTQHAFSSGYDVRTPESVAGVFKKFDKAIGLKYLRMSHMNDSKIELGGRKDRHEHIGDGLIGESGFKALLGYFLTLNLSRPTSGAPSRANLSTRRNGGALLSLKGETKEVAAAAMPLILETEHDKVEADIKLLKSLRDKTPKK